MQWSSVTKNRFKFLIDLKVGIERVHDNFGRIRFKWKQVSNEIERVFNAQESGLAPMRAAEEANSVCSKTFLSLPD